MHHESVATLYLSSTYSRVGDLKHPAGSGRKGARVTVSLEFEWDRRKAALNNRKHGVSFEEAATAFGDPRSLTVPDPEHSRDEDRFVLLGVSYQGRLLVVVHTERGDNLRIISARRATKRERQQYGEVKR